VYADSAYRSVEGRGEAQLSGLAGPIHQRANRNHPLLPAQENANRQKSKVRARIEHVFGAQQNALGGRIVRTIGIARAKAKIGLKLQSEGGKGPSKNYIGGPLRCWTREPCYLLFGLGPGGVSGRGAETPVVVEAFSEIHVIVVRSYL
jgi:hypothetical protein